jgi:FixJ family two-component response regulator/AraC-like DNA-binding protein
VATLLWVDDEVDSTAPTVRLLVRRGFAVDCAQLASAGLSMALSRPYDVIILDLRLPDGSGLGVLDALRARGIEGPIVLLTGFGTIPTAMAAGQLGASRFLQKPLSVDVLISTVQHLIDVPLATPTDNVAARLSRRLRTFLSIVSQHGVPLHSSTQQTIEQIEKVAAQPRSRAMEAIALIEADFLRGRRPKQEVTAATLGIDRAHLGRIILNRTGIGYREWKRLIAMALALDSLSESDESISQIAYKMGFDHHSRFDVEFHQTFGMAPSRFRDLGRKQITLRHC